MKKDIRNMEEAVFLIDMNNGFCEKGKLADPTIKQIVPNIIPIIKNAVVNPVTGYFEVNDKHTEDSVELLRYLIHCHEN